MFCNITYVKHGSRLPTPPILRCDRQRPIGILLWRLLSLVHTSDITCKEKISFFFMSLCYAVQIGDIKHRHNFYFAFA